jgi:hypothetical protein
MRTLTVVLVIVPATTLGFAGWETIQGNPNAAQDARVGTARGSVNRPGFTNQELR